MEVVVEGAVGEVVDGGGEAGGCGCHAAHWDVGHCGVVGRGCGVVGGGYEIVGMGVGVEGLVAFG